MGTNTNIGAAALGAALGLIIVYLGELIAGVDIPFGVEGAITVVVTAIVGYIVPPTRAGIRRDNH